jgi:hypothetical protein
VWPTLTFKRSPNRLAVPYRASDSSEGFGVFPPEFLDSEELEPPLEALEQAFFRGVSSHEKGAAVWDAFSCEPP